MDMIHIKWGEPLPKQKNLDTWKEGGRTQSLSSIHSRCNTQNWKALEEKSIDFVFSPLKNIRKLLKWVKDPIDPALKKAVYMISCECGNAYIGAIGNSIRTSVKEHYANIQLDRMQNSTLAQHSHGTKHPIKIEDMKVLAHADNLSFRRIKDAIEIVKHPNCLNRDDGLIISKSWLPNVTKLS